MSNHPSEGVLSLHSVGRDAIGTGSPVAPDAAPRKLSVRLTDAARGRMRDYLANDPVAIGVRFGVKRTGCSGFGYTVDLATAIDAGDHVVVEDGLRLVVDAKSLPFVNGTEIDFQRTGLNQTFVFRNPNATGACGCGESFTVDAPG